MTYGIYGNHDYFAIKHNERVRDVLESRPDIQILGFKKAYILWHGYVISLQHSIEDFCLILPIDIDFLSFGGHSHFYHIREKQGGKCERIYTPAMCDYIPNPSKTLAENKNLVPAPGFLTAENYPDYVLVTYFSFKYNTIVREDEFIKPKSKKLIIN